MIIFCKFAENLNAMKQFSLLLAITVFLVSFCCCESPESEEIEDKTEEVEKPDKGKNPNDKDDKGTKGRDDGNDSTSTDKGNKPGKGDTDPNEGGSGEEHDFNDDNDNTGKDFTTGDTLTCQQFINANISGGVYVYGYIVGACTKSINNADFVPPFTAPQALLIADSKNERDADNLVSIELKSGGKWRSQFNLKDNPKNLGRRVIVFGYRTTYLKIIGIKSPVEMYFLD